jgi:uncharacterized membrane protein YkvI
LCFLNIYLCDNLLKSIDKGVVQVFREEISLGFIYMGTLVGAGFASGQEIIKFFTYYGKDGFKGIIIACTLFFLLGYIILKNAIKVQAGSLRDILIPMSGERLMNIFELFAHLFLACSYYIMLSGCAATLKQGFGIPYIPAVIFLGFTTILWLKGGLKGLAQVNAIMVPVIIFLTLIIFFNLPYNKIINQHSITAHRGHYYIFSAIKYVSYNMMTASMVLPSLGTYTKRQDSALGASLLAAVGLFITASVMWSLTAAFYVSVKDVEIPLMWIANKTNPILSIVAVFILLFAMITTALGVGFALISGLSHKLGVSYKKALLFLLLGIPVTSVGFSRLISYIYPLFGLVGIIFVVLVTIRRFLNLNIE